MNDPNIPVSTTYHLTDTAEEATKVPSTPSRSPKPADHNEIKVLTQLFVGTEVLKMVMLLAMKKLTSSEYSGFTLIQVSSLPFST